MTPLFAQRHYEFLARWLQSYGFDENMPQWANCLADELEQDNPRFNRDRFLRVCGVEIEA